jgi:fructoselysine-6-P-deglycase FrlB-like protein
MNFMRAVYAAAGEPPASDGLRPRDASTTGFSVNAEAQAQALVRLDQAPVSMGLYPLLHAGHDRVILTGTGASHFAAMPSWRRMVARGKPTVWIDAKSLLVNPELVTRDSLVIATSRSGMSREIIALVDKFDESTGPAAIVAVTDDLASPLAAAADCEVLLRSQSSGSPTGFLNALTVHDYIASMILSEDNDDVPSTAAVVAGTTFPPALSDVAAGVAANPDSRLAYIGFGEHAATSLYAASITHATTGIAAECYIDEQIRNDSPQAADADLTALLFSGRDAVNSALSQRLASDLVAAGSTVIVVGNAEVAGALNIGSPASHLSGQVAHGVVIAEHFVSRLAAEVSSAFTV